MFELKTVIRKNRVAVIAKHDNIFIPVYVYWGDENLEKKANDWIKLHPTEQLIKHAIEDAIECDFEYMYSEFVMPVEDEK